MLADFNQEKNTICTVVFTRLIQEVAIDFTIDFTIFGEVLRVENHFLQLPLEAQKLTLKEKATQHAKDLQHDATLLPFLVPLAIMGYMKGEEWSKFSISIANKLEQFPRLKESSIKDDWVREAWQWHQEEDKQQWLHFFCEIYNGNEIRLPNSRWRIIYINAASFTDRFLFAILPKLEYENRADFGYRFLSEFLDEKQVDFILQNLENNKYQQCHTAILSTLRKYKSSKVRQVLLDYYNNNRPFDEHKEVLNSLVNALSQFLDEEVKMVLYSLLTEKEVAVTAYKKLLKFGISQQEIALHLDSILKSNPSIEVLDALISLYGRLDAEWRPPLSQILDIHKLLWAQEKGGSSILFKYKDQTTATHLEQLLNHQDINIRKGALHTYHFSQNSEDINLIIGTLVKKNQQSFETIFYVLKDLFNRHPDPKWVVLLLNTRSTFIYHEHRERFFRTLKELIEKSGFKDKTILPILIEEFNKQGKPLKNYTHFPERSYVYIVEIIELLADKEAFIIDFLLKAMNHRYKEVKNKAMRALGTLSYPDYPTIVEEALKTGDYYKTIRALEGFEPSIAYNKILYKNLVPFNSGSFYVVASLIKKLFPHPENIAIIEKYLEDAQDTRIKSSAVRALMKIPEFLRSTAFKALLLSEKEEIQKGLKYGMEDLMPDDVYVKIFADLSKDDKEIGELLKKITPVFIRRRRNLPR